MKFGENAVELDIPTSIMPAPTPPTSSILSGARNNTFNNATFIIQSERIAAFDRLEKAASPSAFHGYVERPQPAKCYPNTRIALLEALEKWSIGMELPRNLIEAGLLVRQDRNSDVSPDEFRNVPIMWLKGGAGAGKSAVAQTFAEHCEDLGHIVASFFFFSTDPTRNKANRLVASLAYQIAREDPDARVHMEAVVHHDPHIFDQDVKKQVASLILNPITRSMQALDEKGHQRQCVIIIDGLDECKGDECKGGEAQAGIVRAIMDALRTTNGNPDPHQNLPRFLICSRPEESIERAFRPPDLQGMYKTINLSSAQTAATDITTFLRAKFDEIKKTHPRADLIPASWPSDIDISTLGYNSSGHFIYPETVLKYISSHSRPVTALKCILGLRASPQLAQNPFAELDELYRHILLLALEKTSLDTMRHVLGSLARGAGMTGSFNNPSDLIGKFLGLEDGELDTFLITISSLISVTRIGIEFLHKSFNDFLQYESRAGQFYIDYEALRAYTWPRCVDVISKAATVDHELLQYASFRISSCYRSYDFEDGKKSYSLHGLTQQRHFAIILQTYHKNFENDSVLTDPYRWLLWCLEYFVELLDSNKDSNHVIEQAIEIMIDIFENCPILVPTTIPLFLCQRPCKRLIGLVRCSISQTDRTFPGFWNDGHPEILEIRTKFTLLERCLVDDRMGSCRLSEEKFAEGCLSWMTHLTEHPSMCSSEPMRVHLNQRRLILYESVRRKLAPFRWRTTKKTIQPYRTTGRLRFLQSRQTFYPVRTGSSTESTNGDTVSGEGSDFSPRELRNSLSTWGVGRQTTGDGEKPTVQNGPIFSHWIIKGMQIDEFIDCSSGTGRKQDTVHISIQDFRYHEFGFVLSRIPAMLARASKSDAVAALRFKSFPPLARLFPKLTRRAHQAMDQYASRYGYPVVDGCFGSVSGEDTVQGLGPRLGKAAINGVPVAVSSTACVFMIRVWLGCFYSRLLAILGGLDDIYLARQQRRWS